MDLGYITNAGFSKKQGKYDVNGADDDFILSVKVQLSDYLGTENAADLKVYLAVKFGEFIVVCKHTNIFLKL